MTELRRRRTTNPKTESKEDKSDTCKAQRDAKTNKTSQSGQHWIQNTTIKSFVWSLFDEVPIHSIVLLRVFWGLIMAYEVYRYMRNDYAKTKRNLVHPGILLRYYGFEWVPRLNLDQWKIFLRVMMGAALCFSSGFLYHLSALTFFAMFLFLFLQCMSFYLNHFYLILCLCFLYMFMPANRYLSLDVKLGFVPERRFVPRWCVWIIRILVANVYFWAGIAKINEDW